MCAQWILMDFTGSCNATLWHEQMTGRYKFVGLRSEEWTEQCVYVYKYTVIQAYAHYMCVGIAYNSHGFSGQV